MVDQVQFEGESAFKFRTETNRIVADFNTQVHQAMEAMVNNVQIAVSNIQSSMQGARLTLDIPAAATVQAANERNTENSEMDTEARSALDVEGPFNAISESFNAHKTAFERVEWQGQARDGALDAVTNLTRQATSLCSSYSSEFRKAIDAQVTATLEADSV